MSNTSTLSIAYVIHRIERAPNVARLVAACDAAIEGSTLSVHRKRGSEWAVWHGEHAGFSGTFGDVRRHLAAAAEEILDRQAADQIAAVPAPAMVQQQQAQASAAIAIRRSLAAKKAAYTRIANRCAELGIENVEAHAALPAKERLARERNRAYCMGCEAAEARIKTRAAIAYHLTDSVVRSKRIGDDTVAAAVAAAMVPQQVQQQQGRDMRASKPAAGEIRVAALGHLGSPCDPKSSEASLWIVTDDTASRDFDSLPEAQLYAEFCEGIGFIPAREDAPAKVNEQAPAAFEPIDFDPADERPDLVCYSPEHAGVILACMEAESAGRDPRAAEIAAVAEIAAAAATAALRPKGLPSNGWTSEEIAAVIGPLLEEVEETAVGSFDERLRDAAASAVTATKAWLAVHERELSGEHIPFNVAADARDRLQDSHRAHADMQQIVAIGDIGGDRTLWSHRDGLAVYNDGDDEPMLILPRGVGLETVRLVLRTYDRAYDVGKAHGRIEIQAGLRQLLDVAAA